MFKDADNKKIEEAIKLSYNAGLGVDTNSSAETSPAFGTVSLD